MDENATTSTGAMDDEVNASFVSGFDDEMSAFGSAMGAIGSATALLT